jgi:hypothetical protein
MRAASSSVSSARRRPRRSRGAAAEQDRQHAFLLRALLPRERQRRLGRARRGFHLAQVHFRDGARIEPQLLQLERLVPAFHLAREEHDAAIRGAKRVVGPHDLGDERQAHGLARRFGRDELRPRGLGRAPVLAPEIQLPRGAQHQAVRIRLDRIGRQRESPAFSERARARALGLDARDRKLVRARDRE